MQLKLDGANEALLASLCDVPVESVVCVYGTVRERAEKDKKSVRRSAD